MSASDEDTRLLTVAQSISQGTPVDWIEVAKQLDPSSRAIVSELKVLEDMARIHEESPKKWGPFSWARTGTCSGGRVKRLVEAS